MQDQDLIYLYNCIMQRVRENGQDQRLINWTRTLAERVGMTEVEIEMALDYAPRNYGGTHVAYLP